MVDTKKLAIGYICIFLGIYFISIFGSYLYYNWNSDNKDEAPQYVISANNAIASISFSDPTTLVVLLFVGAFLLFIYGNIQTFGAF